MGIIIVGMNPINYDPPNDVDSIKKLAIAADPHVYDLCQEANAFLTQLISSQYESHLVSVVDIVEGMDPDMFFNGVHMTPYTNFLVARQVYHEIIERLRK